MFYCEACRIRRKWPTGGFMSYGRCEVCTMRGPCYDIPAKNLPVVVRVDANVLLVEFGFKCAEQGMNLQATLQLYQEIRSPNDKEAVQAPMANSD